MPAPPCSCRNRHLPGLARGWRWFVRALAGPAAVIVGVSMAAPDLDRMQQLAHERYGAGAAEAVGAWRSMVADAGTLDELEKLQRVNTFLNRRTAFDDDIAIWKQKDYWATPLETLARRAGDCEDFSIAKYMSLRLLGVPAEKLRLIYVRAIVGAPGSGVSQAHMVLGYYPSPDAEPLVLDNLIGDIRTASRRPDLFPIFSFNSEGLWVSGASTSSADPTTRLSRWRSVLERMQQEGL
ncbi:transglutaminase-like cysteine peptidase [Aromatoleum diolicum]|uniref:Transglutaminase n=1 Tax=Aromatoleum diolicum TaxID=75796 RepID=A0ABX1QA17_9RHOO|nr:transglutaminase-like cysteine peptidase [Aromatoleum diolicum]NMG73856.1 transglutaminase [Aromatoleum diolicum]